MSSVQLPDGNGTNTAELGQTVHSNYGPYKEQASEAEVFADTQLEAFRRRCFAQRRKNHPSWVDGRQPYEAFAVPRSTLSYAHYVASYYRKLDIVRNALQQHLRAEREHTLAKIGRGGRPPKWASSKNLLNMRLPSLPDDTLIGTLASFHSPTVKLPTQRVDSSGESLEDSRNQSRKVAGVDSSASVSLRGRKRPRPSQATVGPGGTTSWEEWLNRLQRQELGRYAPPPQPVKKRPARSRNRGHHHNALSQQLQESRTYPENSSKSTAAPTQLVRDHGIEAPTRRTTGESQQEEDTETVLVNQSNYSCPIVYTNEATDTHRVEESISGVCSLCQNEKCEGNITGTVLQFTTSRKTHQVHKTCIEYSPEVYVNVKGEYINAIKAIHRGRFIKCAVCNKRGATIGTGIAIMPIMTAFIT
eukprot:gb/GECG01007070.1/.p1 GENE.gb/GECG01007070.1/~~gb/GECG01007070.1/.p1  ORF type:complete len:417 (+),score=34.11 gb/GECG01007070.1/:1-1251(+)